MRIYAIKKISQNNSPQDLKQLSENIQRQLGLYDEETGELYGVDFHHTDWQISGNAYYLHGVDENLVSIIFHDDNDLVPVILGKEYESCESLRDASNVILDILESEDDSFYEEYSELTMEETFQRNIKTIGRTDYWPHIGYILTNGEALDFSGGGYHRGTDHRAIYDGSLRGMQEFILRGNIRVDIRDDMSYCGLDMYREPTEAQYNTLRNIFGDVLKVDGEVRLSLSNGVESYEERNDYYIMKNKKEIHTDARQAIYSIEQYYGEE